MGKSFLGKKLADELDYAFIDTDRLLEERFHKPIQDILDSLGNEGFLKEEEALLLGLTDVEDTVISPGGSVVYSPAAVRTLKQISSVVYLEAPATWVKERTNPAERGIVGLQHRSFDELYSERQKLYEAMADYTISVSEKEPNLIVAEMIRHLGLA